MKRFTLAVMVIPGLFFLALPAKAGSDDKAEKNPVITPPAPSLYNWTGFYVGAQGGYDYGSFDPNLKLQDAWAGYAEVPGLESHGGQSLIGRGGNAGGVVGYNYQMNHWVFGLEASGSYLWLRNSRETGIFGDPGNANTYSVRTSFKTHYLTTVAPRIGYAWGRFLPYVTGGLALGDLDLAQEIDEHNLFFHQGGSHSRTNAGWMVGGGLQYGINDHWSIRAQYQYIDLGSVDFNTAGTAPYHDFTGTSKASLTEHNATAALIYKF